MNYCYQPLVGFNKLLFALTAVALFSTALALGYGLCIAPLMLSSDTEASLQALSGALLLKVSTMQVFRFTQIFCMLVLAAVLIYWLYLALRNAACLKGAFAKSAQNNSMLWRAAVKSLVTSRQSLPELIHGSSLLKHPAGKVERLVLGFWVLLMTANALKFTSWYLFSKAQTLGEWQTAYWVLLSALGLYLPMLIVTAAIVNLVTRLQQQKAVSVKLTRQT